MTAVERLRAAAEAWTRLEHAATWGPWSVHESWAGKCAVVTDGGHPVAIVSHGVPSETATADADLIARSRTLAPVIADQLRTAAGRCDTEVGTASDPTGVPIEVHGFLGSRAGCRGDIAIGGTRLTDDVDNERCHCFDDALALADAILGEAS